MKNRVMKLVHTLVNMKVIVMNLKNDMDMEKRNFRTETHMKANTPMGKGMEKEFISKH